MGNSDREQIRRSVRNRSPGDMTTICPSKLSKRELEDLYFKLVQNNIELKKKVNSQNDSNRILSTKLQRITATQKAYAGKSPNVKDCCVPTKLLVEEQKNIIMDLQKSNELLKAQVKILNAKLCSARQFMRGSAPISVGQGRHSPCFEKSGNASTSELHAKKSHDRGLLAKTKSVSCQCLEKLGLEKNTSTGTIYPKLCDENKCRTQMDELKLKIASLQHELSESHSEYTNRIARLENEVIDLHEENMRVRSERAERDQNIDRQETESVEMKKIIRETQGKCDDLSSQLTIEKNKVAELQAQVKASNITSEAAANIEQYYSDNKPQPPKEAGPTAYSDAIPIAPTRDEETSDSTLIPEDQTKRKPSPTGQPEKSVRHVDRRESTVSQRELKQLSDESRKKKQEDYSQNLSLDYKKTLAILLKAGPSQDAATVDRRGSTPGRDMGAAHRGDRPSSVPDRRSVVSEGPGSGDERRVSASAGPSYGADRLDTTPERPGSGPDGQTDTDRRESGLSRGSARAGPSYTADRRDTTPERPSSGPDRKEDTNRRESGLSHGSARVGPSYTANRRDKTPERPSSGPDRQTDTDRRESGLSRGSARAGPSYAVDQRDTTPSRPGSGSDRKEDTDRRESGLSRGSARVGPSYTVNRRDKTPERLSSGPDRQTDTDRRESGLSRGSARVGPSYVAERREISPSRPSSDPDLRGDSDRRESGLSRGSARVGPSYTVNRRDKSPERLDSGPDRTADKDRRESALSRVSARVGPSNIADDRNISPGRTGRNISPTRRVSNVSYVSWREGIEGSPVAERRGSFTDRSGSPNRTGPSTGQRGSQTIPVEYKKQRDETSERSGYPDDLRNSAAVREFRKQGEKPTPEERALYGPVIPRCCQTKVPCALKSESPEYSANDTNIREQGAETLKFETLGDNVYESGSEAMERQFGGPQTTKSLEESSEKTEPRNYEDALRYYSDFPAGTSPREESPDKSKPCDMNNDYPQTRPNSLDEDATKPETQGYNDTPRDLRDYPPSESKPRSSKVEPKIQDDSDAPRDYRELQMPEVPEKSTKTGPRQSILPPCCQDMTRGPMQPLKISDDVKYKSESRVCEDARRPCCETKIPQPIDPSIPPRGKFKGTFPKSSGASGAAPRLSGAAPVVPSVAPCCQELYQRRPTMLSGSPGGGPVSNAAPIDSGVPPCCQELYLRRPTTTDTSKPSATSTPRRRRDDNDKAIPLTGSAVSPEKKPDDSGYSGDTYDKKSVEPLSGKKGDDSGFLEPNQSRGAKDNRLSKSNLELLNKITELQSQLDQLRACMLDSTQRGRPSKDQLQLKPPAISDTTTTLSRRSSNKSMPPKGSEGEDQRKEDLEQVNRRWDTIQNRSSCFMDKKYKEELENKPQRRSIARDNRNQIPGPSSVSAAPKLTEFEPIKASELSETLTLQHDERKIKFPEKKGDGINNVDDKYSSFKYVQAEKNFYEPIISPDKLLRQKTQESPPGPINQLRTSTSKQNLKETMASLNARYHMGVSAKENSTFADVQSVKELKEENVAPKQNIDDFNTQHTKKKKKGTKIQCACYMDDKDQNVKSKRSTPQSTKVQEDSKLDTCCSMVPASANEVVRERDVSPLASSVKEKDVAPLITLKETVAPSTTILLKREDVPLIASPPLEKYAMNFGYVDPRDTAMGTHSIAGSAERQTQLKEMDELDNKSLASERIRFEEGPQELDLDQQSQTKTFYDPSIASTRIGRIGRERQPLKAVESKAVDNQLDICEEFTHVCTCPQVTRRDVSVFRSCSGTLRFRTIDLPPKRIRHCSCANRSHNIAGNQIDGLPTEGREDQNKDLSQDTGSKTYSIQCSAEVMKYNRATSPENTDQEISCLTDLPSEKETTSSSQRYKRCASNASTSPGENRATNAFTNSSTMPTTSTFPTSTPTSTYMPTAQPLSDGELPRSAITARFNDKIEFQNLSDQRLDSRPTDESATARMDQALQAISAELAKCRQLLLQTQSQTNSQKPNFKDASAMTVEESRSIMLKASEGRSCLGDTYTPHVMFTLHIGSVVLSDEAVLNFRDMALVLTWQFYDQNVAMTRMRSGRVVPFDFSTEYDLKLSDEFLEYLKWEQMPIKICAVNRLGEPLASCSLPLRDALIHTNRRADMSLALVADRGMQRAARDTDALDAGDEMGVLDLWCMLRAEPRLHQRIAAALAHPASPHHTGRSCGTQGAAGAWDAHDADDASLSADLEPLTKPATSYWKEGPRVKESWPTSGIIVNEVPTSIKTKAELNQVIKEGLQNQSTSKQDIKAQVPFQSRWEQLEPDVSIKSKRRRKQGLEEYPQKAMQMSMTNMSIAESMDIKHPISSRPELKGPVSFEDKWAEVQYCRRSSDINPTEMEKMHIRVIPLNTEQTKVPKPQNDRVTEKQVLLSNAIRSREGSLVRFLNNSKVNFRRASAMNESSQDLTNVTENSRKAEALRRMSGGFKRVKIQRGDSENPDIDTPLGYLDRIRQSVNNQIIEITVLWLALNEECMAMNDPSVQRLYVAYTFLGYGGAELETPLSLPKPKQSQDKCCFNFKKSFQLTEADLPRLGHLAKCRSPNKGSGNQAECIYFTVVSEPIEDPLGLNNCEDIGYAHLYLGDLLAYSVGSDTFTEVVPVISAQQDDVCGVLAVKVDGLNVVRGCLALATATDAGIYKF